LLTKNKNGKKQSELEIGALKAEIATYTELRNKTEEINRLTKEVDDISRDITQLELDLSSSGSTKTVTDIQGEQEVVQSKWYIAGIWV
jgi:uncharacterized protein (UPF0335 family)